MKKYCQEWGQNAMDMEWQLYIMPLVILINQVLLPLYHHGSLFKILLPTLPLTLEMVLGSATNFLKHLFAVSNFSVILQK